MSNVNSLPKHHQKVLTKLITLFRQYNRWPTIMEIAKSLKVSKQSVVNSMRYLERAKHIQITNYGRGVPPGIEVKGYVVALMEEIPSK